MPPFNEFMATNHRDRVVSLRLFLRQRGEEVVSPMNISSQQACELAAWLVIAAGLGEHMDLHEALDYFQRAYREAVNT